MRRVVVTGIGAVTPLGGDVQTTWKNIIASKSGLKKIEKFDASDLAAKVAGEVVYGDGENQFSPDKYVSSKEQRRVDTFIIYGIAAATQAIEDAGWVAPTDEQKARTGVIIGSGIGGLPTIEENAITLKEKGPGRISPFFIPSALINLASGQVSIKYGYSGPNHSVVTACSTGAHAIGDGARMIQRGEADVMIAGGAECALCRLGIAGFAAARALSTAYNDAPEKSSRPWDKNRDGFVMGEGAGIVVLEEYEHAKARGAKIYGEFAGYGMSGDAYHITSPHPEGKGALTAMQNALNDAKISRDDIGYINAHGTSTPMGDELEAGAVRKFFAGDVSKFSMSSTKSSIGHLLGAAGSVEAILSILAMKNGILPPTLNLEEPSDSVLDMDLVPHKAKEKQVKAVLSNSFGFGGTNASLIFKKI